MACSSTRSCVPSRRHWPDGGNSIDIARALSRLGTHSPVRARRCAQLVESARPRRDMLADNPGAMPELSDTVATPDGIDFAYQVAAAKLSSQLDTIDKLDAKLGV